MQVQDVISRHTGSDRSVVKMPPLMRAYFTIVKAELFEVNVCRDKETKEIYLVVRAKP